MDPGVTAALLMVCCCVLVTADPSCDQAQFLHPNGSCVDCPTCGPGEQLTEDCGYGDGGEGRCVACGEGEFSAEEGLAPCWQCTQCSLLNRQERAPCSATSNAQCGGCLGGFYEMRRKSGEMEPLCMPCYSPTGRARKECLPRTPQHMAEGEEPVPASMALIGSASAASAFLLVLLLWVFLLTVERLKQGRKGVTDPGSFSGPRPAETLHTLLPCVPPCAAPSRDRQPDQWAHEKETHSPSIVINLTTNIKSSSEGGDRDSEWEGHEGPGPTPQPQISLEENLEMLDYDTVQDLSLLLDAGGRGDGMRRLGRALGVPPEVLNNLHGFQDLFQYLRTSTYTLLPLLAQAAASLPRPDLVSRIHHGLVATHSLHNTCTSP
ncbi:tumor necrosis factor receptor superfamily member 27-like [Megalops cyprinoides]|uniref:tumor necrosis factor receptor superfamily member 27-like n=1 Tax=Megalops cyprinoides TaxID=118141 RepID=UPI001864407A|nr:tumor necrosis factor receptor superfamily member 27-like [Megalops cyprinoides]